AGVALMSSATPSPLYVDYQESWGTSGTMITVVYAVYALAVLIPLLFLGRLSDAIGRRPVVMAGLALVGASMGLLVVAPDVAWLIVARIVQGIGIGLVTSSAGAALVELHPRRDARVGALVNSPTLHFGVAAPAGPPVPGDRRRVGSAPGGGARGGAGDGRLRARRPAGRRAPPTHLGPAEHPPHLRAGLGVRARLLVRRRRVPGARWRAH